MYELKLALVVILFITSTVAQLGLNEEREDLRRGVNCNRNCKFRSRDPVCGNNGHTYDSICNLELDICKKVNVKLKHLGECSLAEKCKDDRAFRLDQVANGKAVHVPTCLADGTYAPVQCHNYTFFCWCSRVDGKLIHETIQKDKRPQCLGDRTPAPPTPEPPRKGKCRGRRRKQFFDNMNKLLMQGYRNHVKGEGRPQQKAIKWKFDSLDVNKDGILRSREYKRICKSVKKFVVPKRCARQFPRFCDTNQDKQLTMEEWLSCFSPVSGKRKPSHKKCNKQSCTKKSPVRKRTKPTCQMDRTLLLQETYTHNNSMPIPECQPNGKYQPMQCFRAICFCVDELTGNSLEGTAVTNSTPDCSKPLPHGREWPGCTGEKKKKFMEDLKKYLLNKVDDSERSPATEASSGQSVEEFAAVYHFNHLDKNSNNFLEKNERREVKKFFRRSKKLKSCGKKITKYCDVDNDHKVSREEWVACVIMVPHESGGAAPSVPETGPQSPNPFEEILKAEP